MTPPMTTESRAKVAPPGPEPNTIGKGPMKTAPPREALLDPAEPRMTSAKPTKMSRIPSSGRILNPQTPYKTYETTMRMMARTIAMLAHLMSEPNTIGIGPIITTPAPLTLASPASLPRKAEMNRAANPARISKTPTVVRSSTAKLHQDSLNLFGGGAS